MENTKKTIAKNVRRMRQHRGWSQEKLGEKANVSRAWITLIESGKREPSLELLEHLAEHLECKVADLFYEADPAGLLKLNMVLSEAAESAREAGDEERIRAIFDELQEVTRLLQVFGPFTETPNSLRRRKTLRMETAAAPQPENKTQAETG